MPMHDGALAFVRIPMNVNGIIKAFDRLQKIQSSRRKDRVLVAQYLLGRYRMARKHEFIKSSIGYIVGNE